MWDPLPVTGMDFDRCAGNEKGQSGGGQQAKEKGARMGRLSRIPG
jgi:hypothetical protein